MSGAGGWAGRLRERVTIARPSTARDAGGAPLGTWDMIGQAWAAIRPEGDGAADAGGARTGLPLWRIELRPRDLAAGDRLDWGQRTMIVRSVTRDPRMADRIAAIGEEQR